MRITFLRHEACQLLPYIFYHIRVPGASGYFYACYPTYLWVIAISILFMYYCSMGGVGLQPVTPSAFENLLHTHYSQPNPKSAI